MKSVSCGSVSYTHLDVYKRQAYPFLQDGTVVDAGGYEIYAIVPGDDCRVSVYPAHPTEEGEYLDDLNTP